MEITWNDSYSYTVWMKNQPFNIYNKNSYSVLVKYHIVQSLKDVEHTISSTSYSLSMLKQWIFSNFSVGKWGKGCVQLCAQLCGQCVTRPLTRLFHWAGAQIPDAFQSLHHTELTQLVLLCCCTVTVSWQGVKCLSLYPKLPLLLLLTKAGRLRLVHGAATQWRKLVLQVRTYKQT